MSESTPTPPAPIPAKLEWTLAEIVAETGYSEAAIRKLMKVDPRARPFGVRGNDSVFNKRAVDYIREKLKPVVHAAAPVADGVTGTEPAAVPPPA
jgi:hypothetical protein